MTNLIEPPRRVWCPVCRAITIQDCVSETTDTDRCVCRLCGGVQFLSANQMTGFRPEPGPISHN